MHQRAATMVAVSDRQRQLLPELSLLARVHHGLDPGRYLLGDGKGPALFLGRLAREKGPHVAIDVARRAAAPLVLAGDAHWCDHDYFAHEVEPRLDVDRDRVTWIGEIGLDEKGALLGHARALLFPIDWEEPFGLVMIEAMLSGTPVLAFPRGAVPEVIDPGVTGFICHDEVEMAAHLIEISRNGFDRARCRARAIARFGRARMVADYLDIYRAAILGEAAESGRAVVD
jgi:glycosyltransferase involved in cell wall biosynthesis